jgi:hypothetical protein
VTGGERADRFTWEKAIRDPKTGMPRELLCLALVLATYSTGKTGGDIEVSEAGLAADLGYDSTRAIRYLIAELRDGYGVIQREGGGNRYGTARYVLVLPGDLAERARAARDRRAAERGRASKQPKRSGPEAGGPVYNSPTPEAVLPVYEDSGSLGRKQDGSRPEALRPYTGSSASSYQDQDQDQAARPFGASARPGPDGSAVTTSVEGTTGPPAPPRSGARASGATEEQELPLPPWCGICHGERFRFIDLPDGRLGYCPRCHPKGQKP